MACEGTAGIDGDAEIILYTVILENRAEIVNTPVNTLVITHIKLDFYFRRR